MKLINREISWLMFNERVLQEAEDSSVPLLERLKFLGIFSNNQDEFFRVRVATLKRMAKFEKEATELMGVNPISILEQIEEIVIKLHARFEKTYQGIIKELEKENIFILDETEIDDEQKAFVTHYFNEKVRSRIFPIMLDELTEFPMLNDKSIYLAIRLVNKDDKSQSRYSLITIPSDQIVSRFLVLPKRGDNHYIMLLDDVIRLCLSHVYSVFDFDYLEAYTIKVTRDAELDIDNDLSQSMISLLRQGLQRRKRAKPVRFVYDAKMPSGFLEFMKKKVHLKKGDATIAGARYHNFKDFMNFPNLGSSKLRYEKLKPLKHPDFEQSRSMFSVIDEKDVLLYQPFQSFDYLLDLLREAALDPRVSKIYMTVYRVAFNSNVMAALINAVRNGKKVIVVIELRARFDEKSNIYWSNKLEEEGVQVIFGVKGLKVHSKLCMIERKEATGVRTYACIGTGNFHEVNARIYTDHSLFTCNESIVKELQYLFEFFENNYKVRKFKQLWISPFNTRKRISQMINNEIRNAREGKEAFIYLKMNNLVDEKIISKLYRAGEEGVKIKLNIRGICSIVPGVPGVSENIEATGVVDRFLEHTRIYVFCNGGKEKVYIGSADCMQRNMDYRIEVVTPILDKHIKKQLMDQLEICFADNVKARMFEEDLSNRYKPRKDNEKKVRSQLETYRYLHEYWEQNKGIESETSSN